MDAFAVSIGLGIKAKKDIKKVALKAGIFFLIYSHVKFSKELITFIEDKQ